MCFTFSAETAKNSVYNENRDLIWQKPLYSRSSVKALFHLNAKTMKCLSAVTKHVLLLRSWTSFYLLCKSLPTGTEGFGFCLFCNELCVCTYKTAFLLNTGAAALALFTLSQNLILSSQFDLFKMNTYLKVVFWRTLCLIPHECSDVPRCNITSAIVKH